MAQSVRELAAKLKKFRAESTAVIGRIMVVNQDAVIRLNRLQLLAGKNKYDEWLPRYVDDPYFKNPDSAVRYENWKERISPNKNKPKGVMDFFINGYYHNSIQFQLAGKESYRLYSKNVLSASINRKTNGGEHLGLTEGSRRTLWVDIVKVPFVLELSKATGMKTG